MRFLLCAGLLGGALWLSACGGKAHAPTATPAALVASPSAPAAIVASAVPTTAGPTATPTRSTPAPRTPSATGSVGVAAPAPSTPASATAGARVSATATATAALTLDRCHTTQLGVTLSSAEGAAGHIVDTFSLVNRSNAACAVYGFIGAQMLDAQGSPLPTRIVRNGGFFTSQPGPAEVALPPGSAAIFQAEWSDVPSGTETACPAAAQLEVTPPDETAFLTLALGRFALAPCAAGTIDVTPLRPAAPDAGGVVETPCASASLALSFGDQISEPTMQRSLSLMLTNQSTQNCYLFGYPTIVLLDASGQPLPFDYRQVGDQVVTPQPPRRVELAPGASAYVAINKMQCEFQANGTASAIQLVPPGETTPLQSALPPQGVKLGSCAATDPNARMSVSPVGASLRDTIAH